MAHFVVTKNHFGKVFAGSFIFMFLSSQMFARPLMERMLVSLMLAAAITALISFAVKRVSPGLAKVAFSIALASAIVLIIIQFSTIYRMIQPQ